MVLFRGLTSQTSEAILTVLHEKPGLHSKQTFYELQNRGNKTTYQNVHKALKRLAREGVLVEKDFGFFVSKTWIEKTTKNLKLLC